MHHAEEEHGRNGFVFVFGTCIACGRGFGFNPISVPSTSAVTGRREPICRTCMADINAERVAKGIDPFPIAPDAYEPLPEGELP